MTIRPITIDQALPLRRAVLWPNRPIEASMVDGDDAALHFGSFIDETLICTASLFANESDIRLRKFATDPAFQCQGHGSAILEHLIEYARKLGFQRFWLDARQSAVPFYLRFKLQVDGDVFLKRDEPYVRMSRDLSRTPEQLPYLPACADLAQCNL